MEHFKIEPVRIIEDGRIKYLLRTPINAFYHADYYGGGNWKTPGTIENLICTLKNDVTPYPEYVLRNAQLHLKKIILTDLQEILAISGYRTLTVCVVPRAKAESEYHKNQRLFRTIVQEAVCDLPGLIDGTHFIIRHTNTRTTHLARHGDGGDGDMPYRGITEDTCTISDSVYNKDILLIDDLYTKTVNIDEDAIQALFNNGANSVLFYSVGKTVLRHNI